MLKGWFPRQAAEDRLRFAVWVGGSSLVATLLFWPSPGRLHTTYQLGEIVQFPGVGPGQCDSGCLVISYIPSHGQRIGFQFQRLLSAISADSGPKIVVLTNDVPAAREVLEKGGNRLDQVSALKPNDGKRLLSPGVMLIDRDGVAIAVWQGVSTVVNEQKILNIASKPTEWSRRAHSDPLSRSVK